MHTPVVRGSGQCGDLDSDRTGADTSWVVAYESSDGAWSVVELVLDRSGNAPRILLRVTHQGFLVADCLTVDEVARHVPLDQLHVVDDETDRH